MGRSAGVTNRETLSIQPHNNGAPVSLNFSPGLRKHTRDDVIYFVSGVMSVPLLVVRRLRCRAKAIAITVVKLHRYMTQSTLLTNVLTLSFVIVLRDIRASCVKVQSNPRGSQTSSEPQ